LICSFNFLIFLAVCLNISTVINIKILTNSNQQTQNYKFTSHIAAFLSVVLIIEMLDICMQPSYDQNIQLMLKSYLPVVYGTPLICIFRTPVYSEHINWSKKIRFRQISISWANIQCLLSVHILILKQLIKT
jgi:hypothetical protein